jgi:hypothetical protein
MLDQLWTIYDAWRCRNYGDRRAELEVCIWMDQNYLDADDFAFGIAVALRDFMLERSNV